MAAAFENGRLKIARGPPPAGALVGELRALQVRFTAGGRDTYAGNSPVNAPAGVGSLAILSRPFSNAAAGPRDAPPRHVDHVVGAPRSTAPGTAYGAHTAPTWCRGRKEGVWPGGVEPHR